MSLETDMSKRKWEPIGAAGGVAFVVLQITAQALVQVGGAEPTFNAPTQEIVTFFMNRNRQLFEVGGVLSAISAIPLIWFLGVLWARLRRCEGEPAWLSLVAFASGLVGVAGMLAAGGGWGLAMFRMDEGLDPEIARLLFDRGNFGFATLWVSLACMLLASGVVALQNNALPRWLGWFSLVVATALLAARAFWAAESFMVFIPYMLFWLWLIATSVNLIRGARHEIQVQAPISAQAVHE